MSLRWSHKEIETILDNDSGFSQMLNGFSASEKNSLTGMIVDPSLLQQCVSLLPSDLRKSTLSTLAAIFETPQKALDHFKNCRFFEARELLESTINIYSVPATTSFEALNQATSFVSQRLQCLCLCLLGEVEWELGNAEKAGQFFQDALSKAEDLDDQETMAKALHGLGNYLWSISDLEEGINCCRKALSLLEDTTDQWQTRGKILSALSSMFEEVGQFDTALDYAGQAVDHCVQTEDHYSLPLALNSRALLLCRLDEYEQAQEDLLLALDRAKDSGNARLTTLMLNNTGMVLLNESIDDEQLKRSGRYLVDALSHCLSANSQSLKALVHGNLGLYHQITGDFAKAEKMFHTAAAIYHRLGARASEARIYSQLGFLLEQGFDDHAGARSAYQKAINLSEQIRAGLGREDYRIGFTGQAVDPYHRIVDSLVMSGAADAAVTYVERSKSRSLLDFMSQPFCNSRAPSNSSDALLQATTHAQKTNETIRTLTALQKKQHTVSFDSQEADKSDPDENVRDRLLTSLRKSELDYEKDLRLLRTMDPESSAMLGATPLTAEEISQSIDPDTCLIELFQTDDVLNLFTITSERIEAVKVALPAVAAQEALESLLSSIRSSDARDIRSHDYQRLIRQPLSQLYEKLIRPISSQLLTKKRVVISPHLFWHYLPFQALYDKGRKEYLCDQFEISYTPSASILSLCRNKNQLNKTSALIFSRDNGDLPYVNEEGRLLEGAFYPHGTLFTDDHAHFNQLRNLHASADIIHFACHGYFDQEQPLLSGLDLPPNAEEKGATFLADLFDMDLKSSLVTLSACDSGLHHITSADELIGLSRGLFYAGAAAALVSLWQVADQSTCAVMERFYWHYTKNNKNKSESLKLAMQAVKAQAEYSHPYYWAPFVLMGDWR